MHDLRDYLHLNERDYLKPLIDLISCKTEVIGHGIDGGFEINGQNYLEKLFLTMGASNVKKSDLQEIDIQKSVEKYSEGNLGHNYDRRYNLYAHFKSHSNKTLMFNGHIDTMPPGNIEKWTIPPYKGTIVNDRIYGLGSCDMKAGLMSSIMAVKLLQDCGYDLPCNIVFTSVVDEEGGGNGSIQAVMDGETADGVIVCEPTSGDLVIATMGFLFFRVSIEGLGIHSGNKSFGVNAIEKSLKIVKSLEDLESQWHQDKSIHLLPAASINIGTIKGGTAASTVADRCIMEIGVHYHIGMQRRDVIESVLGAINVDDSWLKDHPPVINIYQSGESFFMDTESSLVRTFCKSFKKVTQKDISFVGSPAGCDSRIWKNLANCPTIQFGPGNLEQCHSIDEYVSLKSYLESILVYAQVILDF